MHYQQRKETYKFLKICMSAFGGAYGAFSWLQSKTTQAILKGIKPCLMGIILATGVAMGLNTIFGEYKQISFDLTALLILMILITGSAGYQYIQKNSSPQFY